MFGFINLYENTDPLIGHTSRSNSFKIMKFIATICQDAMIPLYNQPISSTMEETPKVLNFQVQLQSLTNLQAKIEQTRRSLNQLAKLQTNEVKSIDAMYKLSMMTTRNKLNLFQTHALSNSKHKQEAEEVKAKQEKIREIKQKEEKQRKEIREQLKRNKENESLTIKNNSLQYDQAIRKNRKLDLQKKEQIVKEIKQEKQQFKESLMNSRIIEKQKKEVALFNTTLAKIQRQPSLAKELSQLMKQKQEMEKRVMDKHEAKEKIKKEIDRLKKMKEDQVALIVKDPQSLHQKYSLGEMALSSKALFMPTIF